MKEKIPEELRKEFEQAVLNADEDHWAVDNDRQFLDKIWDAVDKLFNQEVEKRIAERMPSSPEIFQFVKSNLPWLIKSKRGNLQYPFVSVHANEEIEKHLSHALFEWLRSRLTEKPNNSQNTEGGEG